MFLNIGNHIVYKCTHLERGEETQPSSLPDPAQCRLVAAGPGTCYRLQQLFSRAGRANLNTRMSDKLDIKMYEQMARFIIRLETFISECEVLMHCY